MLVGGVAVDARMHVQVSRDVGVDVTQEGEELLVETAPFAWNKHWATGDIRDCDGVCIRFPGGDGELVRDHGIKPENLP